MIKKIIKIGYCTLNDPFDKRSWSGIHYFILDSLNKYCGEIVPLGPIPEKRKWVGKVFTYLIKNISGKKYLPLYNTFISKGYSLELKKRINKNKIDILFVPGGNFLIAYLETKIPIIYLSDAVFEAMLDYYPFFTNVSRLSIFEGKRLEHKAINKANAIIYPSDWCLQSALKYSKADKLKFHKIPFGANIDSVPPYEDILLHKKSTDKLKILFIGNDWLRKGGSIACNTVIELNKRGIETELIIIGPKPDQNLYKEFQYITFLGALDKNVKEEALLLEKCLIESSLFLLPTRSECFGIVFCEAAAFGLPVVTTKTGGIPSAVIEGKTGYLLPLSANEHEYADTISKIWKDKEHYMILSKNSRKWYEENVNWNAWGANVKKIMNSIL